MNTADIRNMDKRQWVFWVSAVPVTITVIAASLFVIRYFEPARQALGQLLYREDNANMGTLQNPGQHFGGQEYEGPPAPYPPVHHLSYNTGRHPGYVH